MAAERPWDIARRALDAGFVVEDEEGNCKYRRASQEAGYGHGWRYEKQEYGPTKPWIGTPIPSSNLLILSEVCPWCRGTGRQRTPAGEWRAPVSESPS